MKYPFLMTAAIAGVTPLLGAATVHAQSAGPPVFEEAQPATGSMGQISPVEITGEVAVVTDYRFRGISFSDKDPAVQGTIDLAHASGFYAGVWASTLEDSPVLGHTKVDLYAGYSFDLSGGTAIDAGVLYYVYADGEDDAGDSDYFEPYASLSHTIGPARFTLGAAYAWSQSATGDNDNIYVYGDTALALIGTPLTLGTHLGYSNGSLAPSGDYLDWSVTVSAARGAARVSIAYVDTDLQATPNAQSGVVLAIGLAF
ncbi:TorF family putative porin [Croceicoccus sp. F390]|uniref:TorF family putative porin n=1 Tax=Croceicoccus esteveae TaxID=3075597 RepID=A0ABU2ZKL4_9SPHN|nr:TorF family putative porin [Croceicoccus sp. F390]MDT0576859.1 TorF family putative porin [Croceicoccus sp. F390]